MTQYNLILYGTSACHLCEQAEEQLKLALDNELSGLTIISEQRDIIDTEKDYDLYATKIPVLKITKDKQSPIILCWPFDAQHIIASFDGL